MNTTASLRRDGQRSHRLGQSGVTLIMVLMILVVVSLLGVGGAQIAMMSERGARNDRDQQLAWQAAEAGLIDAENDLIYSSSAELCAKFASCPATRPRGDWLLDGKANFFPDSGCGTSGNLQGLCASVSTGKPAWLTADFTDTSSSAATVAFGTFTAANFETGEVGVQPAQAPRYMIEPVTVKTGDASGAADAETVYRVTAMGFGPRTDIQAVVQMLYRL